MSNKGWFNYDADDAFYIETHVDGVIYGPEAVLEKLKKDRESLYKNNPVEDGMYGFVIADALGVPAEFKSREALSRYPVEDMVGYGTHSVPEGTWSDDTSMVLATMDSINEKDGIDCNDMMDKFLSWYNDGKYTTDSNVFDIGITTANSLSKYNKGIEATKCGGTGERDNGNGSLMRMLPIAYYINENDMDEERVELINNVSSLTHGHDISKLGCLIYCDYINNLLNGQSKMQALINVRGKNYTKYFSRDIVDKYKAVLTGNLAGMQESEISSSGYVVNTLTAAIWCLLNTNNYKDAVLKAVNLGEDTDTVAAVCGSMAGIMYTKKSIPSEWIEKLKNRELLDNIINSHKKKSNDLNNFKLIKEQIKSRRNDVTFDKSLLDTLTEAERSEVEELITEEILNHNFNCYYYIDCLSNVDKLDEEFLSTLNGTFKYVVLKGIYLVNGNKEMLNEIIEGAYQNIFCFDLLADIYLATNEEEIYETIKTIYSQMNEEEAYRFIASTKLNIEKGKSF